MISAEYAVLDGARTWAIPTKYGQTLLANPSPGSGLKWRSFDVDGKLWFEGLWDNDGSLVDHNNAEVAETLHRILSFCKSQDAHPFEGWNVTVEMDFPNGWGLGSSSSLVAVIAKWLDVDPFAIFDECLSGSGYDVAVAYSNRGTLYKLTDYGREILHTDYIPPFAEHLYFAYSGNKQNSASEVKKFSELDEKTRLDIVPEINTLTKTLHTTPDLGAFQDAVRRHETIIGTVLERPTMNQNWPNLVGAAKHLGAWGGDFFLLATESEDDLAYLRNHGITTILPWNEMLLDY